MKSNQKVVALTFILIIDPFKNIMKFMKLCLQEKAHMHETLCIISVEVGELVSYVFGPQIKNLCYKKML